MKADSLSGIIEIDETLFRYSEKGARNLSLLTHKRGGDNAGRGQGKGDWVPVLMARDRNRQVFDMCLDLADGTYLTSLLKERIADDSVICSDGFLSYKKMVKGMKVNIANEVGIICDGISRRQALCL
ncbi:transposase [Shewanella sp. GXUN23E]|uniref:transposase n=1 Tax=Shewanella sp. GXUN23E TaxID=3422498 RepID=UPI003D7E5E89